ncbi:MAG TPA: glycoside hydrolase family 3 N-terminal domain-containing protein, partial [Clostridia bacterium]
MLTTLEQKIGQLMLVGWQSPNADDLIENIKKYNFGNVILFTRNIKSASQIQDMCSKIQEAAMQYNGAPCFIALDQEGGSVRRIYDGITNTPGAMAIAAASAKYPEAAAIIGNILGAELKALGINLNLAPVVDINSNPLNPIIAIRSFGDDPYIVKKLATDFAKALQNNGIMSCYKHFLGHGDVDIDSHIDLPRINKSIDEIKRLE